MLPSAGEKQHRGKNGKGISRVLYLPGLVGVMTVVQVSTHKDPSLSCDLCGGHAMAEIKTPVLAANSPHLQCVLAV